MVSNNRVAPTTDSRNVSRRRELRRRLAPALLAVALLALGLVSPGLAAAAGPGEVWLFKTASGPHVTMLQQSLSSVGLNPGPIDGVFGDQTLQAVRSFQVSRGLKSDGLVGPETSSFLADAVKSGLRILGLRVDHDPGSDSGGTTPPPPPLPPSDGTGGTTPGTPPAPPSGGTKPLAGKTVVLDPGHGGANPGAIGVNGIREAEINLNHALKVRDHLQAAGAKVIMTRTTMDRARVSYAPTASEFRAATLIANNSGADIFVSIHGNSNPSSVYSGVQSYYYAPRASSYRLASALYKGLLEETGMQGRGLLPATFYVLRNTQITQALVEIGFLTNRNDAALLATEAFRRKAAYGVYKGILYYFGKQ